MSETVLLIYFLCLHVCSVGLKEKREWNIWKIVLIKLYYLFNYSQKKNTFVFFYIQTTFVQYFFFIFLKTKAMPLVNPTNSSKDIIKS